MGGSCASRSSSWLRSWRQRRAGAEGCHHLPGRPACQHCNVPGVACGRPNCHCCLHLCPASGRPHPGQTPQQVPSCSPLLRQLHSLRPWPFRVNRCCLQVIPPRRAAPCWRPLQPQQRPAQSAPVTPVHAPTQPPHEPGLLPQQQRGRLPCSQQAGLRWADFFKLSGSLSPPKELHMRTVGLPAGAPHLDC